MELPDFIKEDSLPNELDLHLPEDRKFVSQPPLISIAQMMERSRQLRAWCPGGIRSPEERWQAKTTEEFHL